MTKQGKKANYVGITKQKISKRLYQHNRKGKGFSRLDTQFSGLTLNQEKSIEQYYIQLKNGPNKLNKINSISPTGKYKNFYDDAIEWAKEYIYLHKK